MNEKRNKKELKSRQNIHFLQYFRYIHHLNNKCMHEFAYYCITLKFAKIVFAPAEHIRFKNRFRPEKL